tara:strand:+ start:193 stop:1416 length:1224 start_codon:yes stop_codon:yes gene_type:complete
MIKPGSNAFNLITRYSRKRLASPNAEGIMEVMDNKQVMDFVQDLVGEFNRFGVPESAITKIDDVGKFANQIVDIKQQQVMNAIKRQITPKKSADIIELQTGKKIDQSKGIMGGREIPETEAEIKARIEKSNKETIARIKMVDDAIEDASPGFSGDRKIDAELVAENLAQRRGLVYDDLSTKERAKIYGEAFEAISKKFRDDLATGGRAGFKVGSPSKRAFLKAAGGIAALLTAIKSGLIGTGGKETTKQVVKESVKDVANTPPKYFFDLVNKIKILGNETKSISPRTKTTTYKNYELEEDLTTGDLTVVKQKGDPDFAYEEEVLIFRKGQADETTKGKTPPDEYEELTVRPDGDGKMKDVEDGIEPEGIKEIQEELSEGGGNIDELTLQKIKRGELAGGGLAYMLGE